jgi:MOSC domain-containing protein
MAVMLEHLYRFPVKGLQGERLDAVALAAGQGLPHDRRFAIARGDSKIDATAARWQPKERFVMLMRDTVLARLGCRIEPAAGTLELGAPGAAPCVAAFGTVAGRAQIEAYVNDLVGVRREGRARWVEAGETSLTDVPQNCLSLINLESVRELEARVGRPVHHLRFRGNLYVSGAPPWAEFDWVGREIRIGEVALRVPARIPRCAATGVNPATGTRDLNVVKALRAAYGHHDMGVYAEVVRGGRVAIGDVVTPPAHPRPRSRLAHWLRFYGFLARSAPVVLRRR